MLGGTSGQPAGNAATARHHARATVAAGARQTVSFDVPTQDTDQDIIDIWYGAGDQLTVTVETPGGDTSPAVAPGMSTSHTFPGNERVFIDSTTAHPSSSR